MSIRDMIHIVQGDITHFKGDVIVNAANSSLIRGGGVDDAIHQAAGPELEIACSTLDGCETGDCKMTPAFNLPCKAIIHAVGPIWEDGSQHEAELLQSCYIRSLDLCAENDYHSIAFPCISTGVYGYPRREAAKIALDSAVSYLRQKGNIDITFVCFFADDKKIYDDIIREMNL